MSQKEKKEPTFREILESNSYKEQKALIQREINSLKVIDKDFAPPRFADLRRVLSVNYKIFKKPKEEKLLTKPMKLKWRDEQRRKFGPSWTKRKATKKEFRELFIKQTR